MHYYEKNLFFCLSQYNENNEEIWKNMIEDIAGKELVWPLAPFDPTMLPKDSPSYVPEDDLDAYDG